MNTPCDYPDNNGNYAPQIDEAIRRLKAQPSEDCISRQAVIGKATSWNTHFTDSERYVSLSDIMALPPVTPKAKVGHWIYTPKRRLIDETDEGCVYITDYRCTCSECGGDFGFQKMSDAYCKYCGAEMNGGGEDA